MSVAIFSAALILWDLNNYQLSWRIYYAKSRRFGLCLAPEGRGRTKQQ